MARFKISDVKADARGHWPAIAERVAGIGDDYLTANHGPCPKCGGSDRWRVFDDFAETGGAICNQCGKFGDGLALIQWFTGWGFPVTLEKVAEFLGTAEAPREKGSAGSPAKPMATPKPTAPPVAVDIGSLRTIEIFPDSDRTDGAIKMWCFHKKGLSFAAAKQMGACVGRYRKRHHVIAFPVLDVTDHQVGWTVYESGGGMLPQFKAGSSDPIAWLKVKTIKAKG